MIDFSTLQGLTIPEGVVTQITDASGRVLWSAIKETGSLILRPSADISVEHALVPTDSTSAYLLINEEVSDGEATYIRTSLAANNNPDSNAREILTSKFKLATTDQLPSRRLYVTSAVLEGTGYCSSSYADSNTRNELILEINGRETQKVTSNVNSYKPDFTHTITEAASIINEEIAINGVFPNINLIVVSYSGAIQHSTKMGHADVGVSQIYLTLGYEA